MRNPFKTNTVDSIIAAHTKTIEALEAVEVTAREAAYKIDAEIEVMALARNKNIAEGLRAASIAAKMRSILE